MTADVAPVVSSDTYATWQPLPRRGRWLFALQGLLAGAGMAVAGSIALSFMVAHMPMAGLLLTAALWLLAPAVGIWLGLRTHRYIAWSLGSEGFALRRGRLWFTETRIPAARVQHLDVKHGPLARRFGLATLVLHTAGTRDSAVSVPGLDADDAAHLREVLGRQPVLDGDD